MNTSIKNSILIVDDEKSNLKFLNSILSPEYTILIAKGGKEALDKAKVIMPDLILLDIIMPDMDGFAVLAELKSSELTQDIPVVFITGLDSNEDEEKGLALRAADYITKPFSPGIVKLRVGNQIRLINQMRDIERLSMTDQLTGIANRRNFDQKIDIEWRRAIRHYSPISIMMIDVDKFKLYNDTYGHQQGDAALRSVATILSRTLRRPTDLAARWGGEEFVVLLPATDLKGTIMIAEHMRSDVENIVVKCPNGIETNITISVGVNMHIPVQNDSIDEFISKADTALYTAKKMGRNRVCTIRGSRGSLTIDR